MKKNPKTPHEEIMFCIESTNDIASEILEFFKWSFPGLWKSYKEKKK